MGAAEMRLPFFLFAVSFQGFSPGRERLYQANLMIESGQVSLAKGAGGSSKEMSFEDLVAKLAAKDRHCVDRQIAARETSPIFGLADRWRRLAGLLLGLAPGLVKLSGLHTMQFYIADGKYRKQVFALHALPESAIAVCIPDILNDAIKLGMLAPKTPHQTTPKTTPATKDDESNLYRIGKTDQTLTVDIVSGTTLDPQIFYKDMTGWNRRALCITLAGDSNQAQIRAVEDLCKFAAIAWANAAPPPALAATKS
jgi:hypothetical protein